MSLLKNLQIFFQNFFYLPEGWKQTANFFQGIKVKTKFFLLEISNKRCLKSFALKDQIINLLFFFYFLRLRFFLQKKNAVTFVKCISFLPLFCIFLLIFCSFFAEQKKQSGLLRSSKKCKKMRKKDKVLRLQLCCRRCGLHHLKILFFYL